ncbi:retrovirus-related Pol polyprotein from transposon 412 [Trichonephila clavipes]|nr:retrovirus-related Pol polyprotein from transposon 412 [Trichonephila clavipes]
MSVRKDQLADPEIKPIVEFKELSDEKPSCNQQDWDKKLPFFLLAYRSAVHETTGYSLFQMLFGRDLRLPADLLFSQPPDASLAPEEYVKKLQAQMEEIHLARERIGMASEKMKT